MQMHRGGFNVYRGAPFQRGYGLGDQFRRFFSWIVPIVSRHALPALKEVGQTVGKEALSTAADIAKDTISGKNFREAAEERVSSAIETLKTKAEEKLLKGKGVKGKGIKRSKKMKKYTIIKKKKELDDIFQ
jgi:hypothetical protein